MTYEHLNVETRGRVGLVTLNRPAKFNALCDGLMNELTAVLDAFDVDDGIGCVIITGSERAFAAGADISEMQDLSFMEAYKTNFITRNWERLRTFRKPVIAAVAGFAFGGGCELAMMCDFIIAAENAVFSQPEIALGVLPGGGGTQRLPRAIGKAKAMELCLTGRRMDAREAEAAGLVARIVPLEKLMEDALATAEKIASFSLPATMMVKECVNRAFESSLSEGILYERRTFHSAFATRDQKEGMTAFVEKRKPGFTHE